MQIVSHLIIDRSNSAPNNKASETLVLAHKDSCLYIAIHKGILSKSAVKTTDPSTWTDPTTCLPPQMVILPNLYPAYEPDFTKYMPPDNMAADKVFVKHVNLLDVVYLYGMQGLSSRLVSQMTTREMSVCELLRRNGHRNIAEYKGVRTGRQLEYAFRGAPVRVAMDKERVLGLVFKRYDCTLWDLVYRRLDIDVEDCLKSVACAICHLHRLGLVHGDVGPENVFVAMFDHGWRNRYVLGDFDTTQATGSVLRFKGGDARWARRKVLGRDRVELDDDWYGFEKLKRWLCRELGLKLDRYRGIGSWRG